MSRTGKRPIQVPSGTKVSLKERVFVAEGPKGKVSQEIVEGIDVQIDGSVIAVTRADDTGPARSMHGLVRALLANAVRGVSEGWTKELEIVGVGYRADARGKEVHFSLGYSHPVVYHVPEGIEVEVDRQSNISVKGADRQSVGQVAAEIRSLRRPDAYKGKGIRYKGEHVKLKVGKSGVA